MKMMIDNKLTDRFAFSAACLDYAESKLQEKGAPPLTQELLSKEFRISQSMISQIRQNPPKKALSVSKIECYARRQGMSLGELCLELLTMNEMEGKEIPYQDNGRVKSDELLIKALDLTDVIERSLFVEKKENECTVELFYQKTLSKFFRLFADINLRPVATGLFFSHPRHFRTIIANDATATCNVVWFPEEIPSRLRECFCNISKEDSISPQLLKELVFIRPPKNIEPKTENFWVGLTKRRSTDYRDKLKAFIGIVHREKDFFDGFEGGSFSINTVFLFDARTQVPEIAKRVMKLVNNLFRSIYGRELEAHNRNLTTLIGVPLFPSDVRPHSNYYPLVNGKYTMIPEELEAKIGDYLGSFTNKSTLLETIIAAEIWCYDWTAGKFIILSDYFKYVNPAYANRPVLLENRRTSFTDAYRKIFADLHPSPYGQTSQILISKRSTFRYSHRYSISSNKRVHEVINGTMIGIPLLIYDKQNQRLLHSVMYTHFATEIMEPEKQVNEIRRICESEYVDTIRVTARYKARDLDCFSETFFADDKIALEAVPETTFIERRISTHNST